MENTQKIALVTGGSRGLGKDMAISLAKKGHHVIVTYADKSEEADNTVRGVELLGKTGAALQLDLRNFKGIDKFIVMLSETLNKKFKAERFDFLINNAGMGA
ncbi:MAG: SDR family NAD(P)-dependent oxidoreductase, partial [Bacteroidia bacterium]